MCPVLFMLSRTGLFLAPVYGRKTTVFFIDIQSPDGRPAVDIIIIIAVAVFDKKTLRATPLKEPSGGVVGKSNYPIEKTPIFRTKTRFSFCFPIGRYAIAR